MSSPYPFRVDTHNDAVTVTTSMLECFVAIADEGGLGNAARALGVSQPSLSQTLTKLETHLRVTLFRRSSNALVLTPEGAAVLPAARQAVADHRGLERLVNGMREGRAGPLTLAVTAGVFYELLMPDLAAAFTDVRPDARIEVVPIVDPAEAAGAVRDGSVDAAVLLDVDVPDDLSGQPLSEQQLVFALPPALGPVTRLADLVAAGPVRLVTSAHTDWGEEAMQALQEAGLDPVVVVSGIPLVAVPGQVAAGVGAAVMTEPMSRQVVQAGGSVVAFDPPLVSRAALVFSGAVVPPLLAAFLDRARVQAS